MQEWYINVAGDADHVPDGRRVDPALELTIPARVIAGLNLTHASAVEVLLVPFLLELLCVVVVIGLLGKLMSLESVSHLAIQWQFLLSEPSFTVFNDALDLVHHQHFGKHCIHMLLFPRRRSTRDTEVLIHSVFSSGTREITAG